MRKRIVSIVLALCMVLMLVSTTAFAETTTGTNDADKFSWDNATVYYLVTDRFKNGDTKNDHSYERGLDANGNVITGVDDRGTFHGGDFVGITQAINEGYFDNLGVNVLCISAAYEQIHGYIVGDDGRPSFAHYSYHGNYVLDYTGTDANFGTVEEFQTLVDTAHDHGLRVVMNVVMNHAGYNTMKDMEKYGFGTLNRGWDNYYYGSSSIDKEEYNSYIDYTTNADDWANWWGSGWVRASLPEYTQAGSDNYTMSYCGLPDFKTESTKAVGIPNILETKWKIEGALNEKLNKYGSSQTVTNHISKWLSGWVREYGIDGFRCGTAEYVDLASWNILKTMCTDALREWKKDHPDKALDDLDFWMTGECQNHGVNYDDYYTQGGFDSMINSDTAGGGVLSLDTVAGKFNDYATAVNTNDNFNVLSSISSDSTTLARGDQKYLGSALLLLPGGVQIFYGDETNRPLVSGANFDGNGGDGHSLRSDMNWSSMDEDVLAHWQKVGTFRNNHIAVGAGTNISVDANSGVGFVRTYSKGTVSDRVAACIGASAFTEVTMDVSSAWNAGDKVVNYYDGSSATVALDGTVTFSSGANGTILIGDPDGKPVISINGKAKFKDKQQVTISIEGSDCASVSIDGGEKFTAHDGDKFTIGETASEGATVTVSCEATNEKGTTNCKATFYKASESEDVEAPVISGVKDGETYCSAQTVTVTDNGSIQSVTVNGTAVDLVNDQFTLSPSSGTQEIIATDNAKNSTKVTVTVNDGHTDNNNDRLCDICGAKILNHTGGVYIPLVQMPTIETVEGVQITLSADGKTATITVDDGYEIADVMLNGVSLGKVTEVKNLKTGDKLVVTAEKKAAKPTKEEILAALADQQLTARSKLVTMKNGKKAIKITWYNKNGETMDFDGVEIYRSTKRYSGYGKKPIFTTEKDAYYNTAIQEGTKYYYKVRGFVIIDGQKCYTDYSRKAIRTAN